MNLAWLLAEFIGTFTLIFIGVGSICLNEMTQNGVGLLGIATAHGLAIGVMVSALGQISGGKFNPAISLGLWAGGKQGIKPTLSEIVAQLLGGIVGALFLTWIFPPSVISAVKLGTPALGAGITPSAGIFTEVILTFLLVFTVYGAVVDSRGAFKAVGGLAIGFVILFDILMGGGVTGGAMNPARAFGPALISGEWAYQYIYWIGPILGGLIAGVLYSRVMMKNEVEI
jgi:MIP family channel proteins